MATKRRNLSKGLRKKLRRPEGLKEEPTVKVLKIYPKEQCMVEGCTNNAVGKGITCKQHGGDPVIPENLLQTCEIPAQTLIASKFEPATHPISFIALSREGMSAVEIAAEFGVSVNTLRNWSEKYADFNTAYEVGQAMHEAWWLQEGKNNLDNRGYNTGLYKFITGNKLGFSDKIESKNLNITAGVLMVPEQLNIIDWEDKNGPA